MDLNDFPPITFSASAEPSKDTQKHSLGKSTIATVQRMLAWGPAAPKASAVTSPVGWGEPESCFQKCLSSLRIQISQEALSFWNNKMLLKTPGSPQGSTARWEPCTRTKGARSLSCHQRPGDAESTGTEMGIKPPNWTVSHFGWDYTAVLREAARTRAIHFSTGLAEPTASQTQSAGEGI